MYFLTIFAMGNSILLAQVIGPIFLVIALHILLYKKHLLQLVDDLMKGGLLVFLSGFMALTIGMILITVHNVWVSDWPVIITIIGWLSFLKGVFYLLVPDVLHSLIGYVRKATTYWMVGGIAMLLVGVYLIYVGFLM